VLEDVAPTEFARKERGYTYMARGMAAGRGAMSGGNPIEIGALAFAHNVLGWSPERSASFASAVSGAVSIAGATYAKIVTGREREPDYSLFVPAGREPAPAGREPATPRTPAQLITGLGLTPQVETRAPEPHKPAVTTEPPKPTVPTEPPTTVPPSRQLPPARQPSPPVRPGRPAARPEAPRTWKGTLNEFGKRLGWPARSTKAPNVPGKTELPVEKVNLDDVRAMGVDEAWARQQAKVYRDIADSKIGARNPSARPRADWLERLADRLRDEPLGPGSGHRTPPPPPPTTED